MLELYHHGSSVCAAKVRLCLEEKRVAWEGHYIDILKGEQFTDSYLRINPKGVVPTLIHDGYIVPDSTVICEYLEDVFTNIPLRPRNPREHARSLHWTKAVDEELHPACGELTFAASHRFTVLRLGEKKVEEFLNSTPESSVTLNWHSRKKEIVRHGFQAAGIAEKVRLYDRYLKKMESELTKSAWLAGDRVSLADVAMLPYVMRLDMLSMSAMWQDGRLPLVEKWLDNFKARPSFLPAIWKWIPEELTNDLKTNGQRSWPEVAEIIQMTPTRRKVADIA